MLCVRARSLTSFIASGYKNVIKSGLLSRNYAMLVNKVTVPSENALGECPAVVIKAIDSSSTRGLIVLQEWWGMNQQIQDEASDIAEKGKFVALVPDLYRGKVATDHETAGHYMNDLDWAGAVKDIAGAAKYLLSNGCTKVGVTGFCMGGALSLAAAALVPEVSAAAPFYGIPGAQLCDVSQIKIPVQGHFGKLDYLVGFSSAKDVEALEAKLKSGKVNYEIYSYDTGHAFTNPTNPNYSEEICNLALQRMMDFMNKNL